MKRNGAAILLLLTSGLVTTLIMRVGVAIVKRIVAGSGEYVTVWIVATMMVSLLLAGTCVFLCIRKAYRIITTSTVD